VVGGGRFEGGYTIYRKSRGVSKKGMKFSKDGSSSILVVLNIFMFLICFSLHSEYEILLTHAPI
jgi:hypothetical protein